MSSLSWPSSEVPAFVYAIWTMMGTTELSLRDLDLSTVQFPSVGASGTEFHVEESGQVALGR